MYSFTIFHKKNNNIIWVVASLLLGCSPVSISSIHDIRSIAVSLTGCNLLGSASCLEGTKKSFVFQCKGSVYNTKSKGSLGIIGIPASTTLSANSLEQAMQSKNEVGKLLWQKDGSFIFWQEGNSNGSENFTFKVDENAYQKFTAHRYNTYMVYVEQGSSYLLHSTHPIQIDMTQGSSHLDYKNLQLQAIAYGTKQVNGGVEWLLKGSIAANASISNAELGFILAKEGVDPYILVQKTIGSGEVWPTTATLLNDCIVVPGRLRQSDSIIEGHLLSYQLPIKSGNFKVFCYLIQNNHYYLSQMEHIWLGTTAGTLSTIEPPSITFTGSNYRLEPLDLQVYCERELGHVRAVKFSNNNQIAQLPVHLQSCVLFLRKGTIWRTTKAEALFEQLHFSNSTSSITDDATLCLVADGSKELAPSCIDFFIQNTDYQYFICLFSTEDKKLKFYTEKQRITIENKEIQSPVTLKVGNDAALSLTNHKAESSIKVLFNLPTVSLLSGSGIAKKGFLIANSTLLSDNYMGRNSAFIDDCIKRSSIGPVYRSERLVYIEGEGDIHALIQNLCTTGTWTAHNALKELSIVYWVQCVDGRVILSQSERICFKEEIITAPKEGAVASDKSNTTIEPENKINTKKRRKYFGF